jgi:serine/threonine protein kinase
MVRCERQKLLKYSPKTIVSLVAANPANGRRVCVKEYRYKGVSDGLRHLFRQPKGRVSWVAGNALFSRGMSPLKPLAYTERRTLGFLREAFFVTESMADSMEMDRYLIRRFETPPGGVLRRFIEQFGLWIGNLHRAGIYHRDLKTCNILVRENRDGWDFSLIDLEDVILGRRVGVEEILRSVVQINCSVPKFFSYGDRMRFLSGYLRAHPALMDKRVFVGQVLEESRKRGIVYVSPEGDVMEEFDA